MLLQQFHWIIGKIMRILHTSDWHLGRSLYGRRRYKEFSKFLNWLANTIEDRKIDLLVVSGDVFDSKTPANKAQELYYRFLCRISDSCCSNVIIVAGNHDSPSFLDAPGEILRTLNIFVVGDITEDSRDEVFVVSNSSRKNDFAVVCAVPYLADRHIRKSESGESIEDKNKKLAEGMREHYAEVAAVAEKKCRELSRKINDSGKKHKIPIIATGHLFTKGGKTVDGDGVRELYAGNLVYMDKSIFPKSIDYFALGHLHIPQKVAGREDIRYSGSPLPVGFGEAKQRKSVFVIDMENGQLNKIETVSIPCFRSLKSISGSLEEIREKLMELSISGDNSWLEIEYTGKEVIGDLRMILEKDVSSSEMEILRIKNPSMIEKIIGKVPEDENLDNLDEYKVFEKCLEVHEIPEEEREKLRFSYKEILQSMRDEDTDKE